MTDCKHSWTIYWGESHAECYNCNRRLVVDDIECIINKYDDLLAERERLLAVVLVARNFTEVSETEWYPWDEATEAVREALAAFDAQEEKP